jgi:hypothetical protein
MSLASCLPPKTCSGDTDSSSSSISDVGRIIGIVIGSVVGLTFLICIIVTIYMVFHKRKSNVQVWAYPYPGSQTYGQSMPMYPYGNYPQAPIQQLQPQLQKVVDEPPPAYEEISTIEDSASKI